MAFSENLTGYEGWGVPSSLSGTWFSDACARDTEALTKALQQSLSRRCEPEIASGSPFYSYIPVTTRPETLPGSRSEPEASMKRVRNPMTGGKISKRKSRAANRSPTTYLTADPANFRRMVQQVTGVRVGGPHVPVGHVVKREPQRAVGPVVEGGLPTLDTSAFLVGQELVGGPSAQSSGTGSFGPESAGLDSGNFRVFPTLESWHTM